ncbi:MAG: hypothetical protein AAF571_07765 [Verrucomicrobiota bacterium]
MKYFLIVLGGLLLIALAISPFVDINFQIAPEQKQMKAQAFIDAAIPEIAKDWSKDTLLSYCAPEFSDIVSDSELEMLVNGYSERGKIINYIGSTGTMKRDQVIGIGYTNYIEFISDIVLESGPTQTLTIVSDHTGDWKIIYFGLKQEVDLPNKAVVPTPGS